MAAIVKDRCPKLKTLISMQKTEQDEQAYSFWQLLEKQEAGYSYEPEPDQLCTIMFTSGTTGKSKGVMLTHRNLAENATCLDMKIPPLSVLPIHHAYCLSMDILKGISLGSIICINDSLLRVAKNIRLFQPDMIDLFESYGITILQGYGMTECAPVISTNVSWDIRKNSVGKLLPNCEAKVVDKELWVRGSSVMQGYYHMPEETKETLVDGWLRTGDLGYVGQTILFDLIRKNGEDIKENHMDCGMLIFDQKTQNTNAGGSGCGCAAATLSAYILPKLEKGEWKRILFVPTGALMSTVSYNEGESVPGIAHGIILEHC